jgi:hypothetical protein
MCYSDFDVSLFLTRGGEQVLPPLRKGALPKDGPSAVILGKAGMADRGSKVLDVEFPRR